MPETEKISPLAFIKHASLYGANPDQGWRGKPLPLPFGAAEPSRNPEPSRDREGVVSIAAATSTNAKQDGRPVASCGACGAPAADANAAHARLDAVLELLRGATSPEDVAAQRGLDPSALTKWREEFLTAGLRRLSELPDAPPAQATPPPPRTIRPEPVGTPEAVAASPARSEPSGLQEFLDRWQSGG